MLRLYSRKIIRQPSRGLPFQLFARKFILLRRFSSAR
jgi:hypothetical protein